VSQLAELQRAFCDALRSPEIPADALLNAIVDDGLNLQRFNVYRNNFIVLNGDALADMYPTIKRLVGDEAFRVLASAYVRSHPPQARTLLYYGDHFPAFLESIPELAELPYLADIARIEFAWTEAYHAQEHPVLTGDQISGITAEALGQCQLMPHPTMHSIGSNYPIYSIWLANQACDTDELISLDQGESYVIVLRPDVDVEVRAVSRGAFHFLNQLQSGAVIESAYEAAIEQDSTFDLEAFLTQHLLDGTFFQINS
jgi:hypothetical protein